MTLAAELAGFKFNGFVDDYDRVTGLYIGKKGIQGWSDGVDLRVDEADNPNGPGALELPGQLSTRTISWEGHAVAETAAELLNYRNGFRSLLSSGGFERLIVDELGEQLWASVQRNGIPEFRPRRRPSRHYLADYLIQVKAPNPRQYGQPVEGQSGQLPYSSAPLELINRGTYAADVTIRVRATSNMPNGYTLWGGDRWLRIRAPLSTGQVHDVDLTWEYVRRNGVIVNRAKHSGQGWDLPSKQIVEVRLEPHGGTGEFSPYFLPTYV